MKSSLSQRPYYRSMPQLCMGFFDHSAQDLDGRFSYSRYEGRESAPRGIRMKCWLLGALALVVWLVVVTARVQAQDSPPPQDQNLITMNFQDVDITVLAKFISEITAKNFVVDESVRGKATILSPSKVTPQQAFSIFQSVLQVKGF